MKTKLRKALGLSWRDRGALLEAWIGLLWSDLALRCAARPRLEASVSPRPAEPGAPEALAEMRHLAWLVEVAGRHHLYPMRCLARALTLRRMLRHRGWSADLRLGVRRAGDDVRAHAWVEYAGCPLGERDDLERRFQRLAPLDAAETSARR